MSSYERNLLNPMTTLLAREPQPLLAKICNLLARSPEPTIIVILSGVLITLYMGRGFQELGVHFWWFSKMGIIYIYIHIGAPFMGTKIDLPLNHQMSQNLNSLKAVI